MSDASLHYDPLTSEIKPKNKGGMMIGLVIAAILHAILFWYLYKAKFEVKYREFSDEATKVDLIKPIAPPPPPPPPPPPENAPPPPPPPKIQPRPPANAPPPNVIAPPSPLQAVKEPEPQPPGPPAAPKVEAPPPAPPAPPKPSVITNPDWTRKPSGDDMARYYPERAQRLEVEGRATISCTVTAKGTVEGCSVVSEDPAEQGFGEAALKMARLFRMKPKTQDGAPVEGGSVRIPLRFQLPK